MRYSVGWTNLFEIMMFYSLAVSYNNFVLTLIILLLFIVS